jgi:hypothetical protein
MGGHLSVDNLSAEETEELCQLTGCQLSSPIYLKYNNTLYIYNLSFF